MTACFLLSFVARWWTPQTKRTLRGSLSIRSCVDEKELARGVQTACTLSDIWPQCIYASEIEAFPPIGVTLESDEVVTNSVFPRSNGFTTGSFRAFLVVSQPASQAPHTYLKHTHDPTFDIYGPVQGPGVSIGVHGLHGRLD